MKKLKTLLLTLAIGLTCATAVTAVACGKTDAEPDWFASESQGSTINVRFEEKQLEMHQYENVQVACTVKGSMDTVVYTSSDEEIATVDQNGIVTAQGKLGDVIITATVGGVSDTCTITVKQSPYSPQIVAAASEFTVEQGETIEFEVSTYWNNAALLDEITYEVSLAESSSGAQATLSVNKNVISVTGNAIETVNVIVSTTVRGIYTSEIFTINVIGATLKIQSLNEAFVPTNGAYSMTISTTDKFGEIANTQNLAFVAMRGSETFAEATISWSIDGDSVVLDGNTIVGKARGMTTLTGTVTVDGETATVLLNCNVVAPVVHLTQTEVLEVVDLERVKIEGEIEGKLQSVELHGQRIDKRSKGQEVELDATKLPKKSSLLGKQQLSFITDIVTYTMDVEIYTMIINSAEELDQMATVANTGETELSSKTNKVVNSEYYDGYFILGNDISYNKMIKSMTDTGKVFSLHGNWQDYTRGFSGIFDGCGYNIDGVTVGDNAGGKNESGGIFGYLAGGIVRNVSFTNASILANNGFICALGEGLVENVSISYKALGGDKATLNLATNTPRVMGSFFAFKSGGKASVRNCLIDASGATIALESALSPSGGTTYNVRLAGSAPSIENVVVITADKIVRENSNADILYNSYEEIAQDSKALKDFDATIWTKVNGVPMFVKQAETLDTSKAIHFINTDDTLMAGFSMPIQVDNPYAKIEVAEVEGVTYKDASLFATEEAFGKTVTITAISSFNPDNKTAHTVYIDSYGKEVDAPVTEEGKPVVYSQLPELTIGDNSWMGEENYVYIGKERIAEGADSFVLDTSKLQWGNNELTIVSIKNGVREHFKITVEYTYKKGDVKDAVVAVGSFFDSYIGNTLVDNADLGDVEVAEGFERLTRRDSSSGWTGNVLGEGYYNRSNFGMYTDLFFAMKVVGGQYYYCGKTVLTEEWMYFHFTQTSKNIWAMEITLNGELFATQTDIDGDLNKGAINAPLNSLGCLLYRTGWNDGFLISRISGSTDTVSIYSTEVLGIQKPKEGTVVLQSALEAGTKSTMAVPGGYDNVYETTPFNKGDMSSANLNELGYDKYKFMMSMTSNLTIPELKDTMDTTMYKNVVVQQANIFFLVELTKTETGWSIFMDITPSYQKVDGTGWTQPSPRGYTFESTANNLSEIFGQWKGWNGLYLYVTEVRGF
ncbi:MAG: Ig-like domain-containing protein [Clostridia bacterium]|nr:Ig-like domain-containing protein [Clostridia bacterium]